MYKVSTLIFNITSQNYVPNSVFVMDGQPMWQQFFWRSLFVWSASLSVTSGKTRIIAKKGATAVTRIGVN